MKMNKHKIQLIKIYGSFLLCPIWLLAIYVLSRLFPGTFQEQRSIGKIAIILLLVSGLLYVWFLVKFLSSKKSIQCMNYYSKKKSKRKKKE